MTRQEHFMTTQYDDGGFTTPELTSNDTYPPYIRDEVERCVKRIQQHQKPGCATFGFITDLHFALTHNHEVRFNRIFNAYREITKRTYVSRLLMGGDNTNDGCKTYKMDCCRKLRSLMDGINFCPSNGNHDTNDIWDSVFIRKPVSQDHITPTEQYNLFYNHLQYNGAEFDEDNISLYYMINDYHTKTRYICLNIYDTPDVFDENGKLIFNKQTFQNLSQAQLKWLTEKALKFDEEGWTIVLFAHTTYEPSMAEQNVTHPDLKEPRCVYDLLEAYKKGEDYSYDSDTKYLEKHIDAKFSQYIRGDIAMFILGHHHEDFVQTSESGIKYVCTCLAVMFDKSPITIRRYDGTPSEILFDVITIDKYDRKIYLTRVGAGEDRVVEY